ncbi:MAG: MFS transporter [Gammaproteobacteria bacterium]|nr:MAG: MFS transporter [Gammaproteobacteria bacterium]
MIEKPRLSFWQIWNMSFAFLGIQFGFALQNANASRIFQTLGAEIEDIAILWIAAPITGLLVQPIIGYMSDKTWTRWGRRRPYFTIGAVFTTLALFVFPNSPSVWIAAGMLWMIDASINISMEPLRAFVGDMLPDDQSIKAFSMQSFFIGIGGVVASSLPWMLTNWASVSNVAAEGVIPDTVIYSFYIGGSILFFAIMWTVMKTKEYTPEQLEQFNSSNRKTDGTKDTTLPISNFTKIGGIVTILGLLFTYVVSTLTLEKELYILTLGSASFGVLLLIAGMLKTNKPSHPIVEVLEDILQMPVQMRKLGIAQLLSWFSLFSMWIYTTPTVANYHYGITDTTSQAYNDAADWVGILFAVYSGVAAIYAMLIPKLVAKTNRKKAHLVNMTFGGLGLISFYFISDPQLLVFSMIGVGIAWSSILSIPYSLLVAVVPSEKIGIYMGIFNFFIVLPQIIAASILSIVLKYVFDGQSIFVIMFAGFCMIGSGLLILRVSDKHS